MERDEFIHVLRKQVSTLLEHGVSAGDGWKLEYNGTWTPAHWIGWVTLKLKNIEIDWPLDDNDLIDANERPWLSVKVVSRSRRPWTWLVPEQWYALGVVGVDEITEAEGPWWERLQEVSEKMATQITELAKMEAAEPVPPVMAARREYKPRRPTVDIEILKQNFS